MSWSYDVTELATSELYQVRQEINDTNSNDQLLQDEEITHNIAVEMNLWGASARCCEQIARGFLRLADVRLGARLYLIRTKAAAQYLEMAKELRTKALGVNVPWIGGMSAADKIAYQQSGTLVQPAFTRDMMVDPWAGEETSDTGEPTTDADLFGNQ